MIRVIVIEDQPIIGTGLKCLFHPSRDDIHILELYSSIEKAITEVESSAFDIIILDLWINKGNPEGNVKRLQAHFPGKPILIFTGEESSEWRNKMMRSGVSGYISKTAMKHEIKLAIQKTYNNVDHFPIPNEGQSYGKFKCVNPIDYLTIFLLSEGYSLGEIAVKQKLSYSAIEKILIRLRRKNNVSNNSELVKVFIESNINS
jgi:DNA-binding NarL/FixJ family response regulator